MLFSVRSASVVCSAPLDTALHANTKENTFSFILMLMQSEVHAVCFSQRTSFDIVEYLRTVS